MFNTPELYLALAIVVAAALCVVIYLRACRGDVVEFKKLRNGKYIIASRDNREAEYHFYVVVKLDNKGWPIGKHKGIVCDAPIKGDYFEKSWVSGHSVAKPLNVPATSDTEDDTSSGELDVSDNFDADDSPADTELAPNY